MFRHYRSATSRSPAPIAIERDRTAAVVPRVAAQRIGRTLPHAVQSGDFAKPECFNRLNSKAVPCPEHFIC